MKYEINLELDKPHYHYKKKKRKKKKKKFKKEKPFEYYGKKKVFTGGKGIIGSMFR